MYLPHEAAAIVHPLLAGADRRHCIALLLDGRNRLISMHTRTHYERQLFATALLTGAHSIVLAHNDPSGDPTPGQEDLMLARWYVDASKMLGIEIRDHIILGEDPTFCSLREEGLLW